MFFVHRDLEKLSAGRIVSDTTGSVKDLLQNWELVNLEYASSNVWQASFSKLLPNLRTRVLVAVSSRQRLAEVVLSQWSGAGFTIGTIDLEEVWSIKEVLSLANDITRTQLESAAFLFKNS